MNRKKEIKAEINGGGRERVGWSLSKKLALTTLLMAVVETVITIVVSVWLGTAWAGGRFTSAQMILLAVVFLALICLVSTFLTIFVSKKVGAPVTAISGCLTDLNNGNLKITEIPSSNIQEIDALGRAVGDTVRNLNQYINEFDKALERIIASDLDFDVDGNFVGDFVRIKDSLNQIVQFLNEMIRKIGQESSHVLDIAGQVSSNSQTLAQGATEQAGAVEELLTTIHEISGKVSETATETGQASDKAHTVRDEAAKSNEQMQNLIGAMDDINSTSKQVAKIVKIIEDIAFQTNILALNAAVEAARAGVNGRSFAVVADEVKNLATKSASAAADTTNLIKNTIAAVEKGMSISTETADLLSGVVGGVDDMADILSTISTASTQESDSIHQVVQGLDQVSSVVQSNSAAAEEIAAVSHELEDSAHQLKKLVGSFKLKKA